MRRVIACGTVVGLLVGGTLLAQGGPDTRDAHVAAAKAAAGTDHNGGVRSAVHSCGRAGGCARSGTCTGACRRPSSPRPLARRAGEGVRQPVFRRPDGVLGVGRDDVGRHHPHRHDLRLLGRRRSRRRAEEARPRSRDDQVRDRQPRSRRSLGRREVPAGPVRHAHHPVGGRLGSARSQHRHEAPRATWSRPTARS